MNTPTPAQPRIDHEGSLPVRARNASLADLAEILRAQHARKVDLVAPAHTIRSEAGVWVIDGADPVLTPEGVTASAGRYRPTAIADEGLAAKLDIPRGYLRRMRHHRPDLYDANMNGWLRGKAGERGSAPDGYSWETGKVDPDPRSFLVRGFTGDDGNDGIARAFLSDRYRVVDNLDVLMAALQGVKDAGAEVEVRDCDLTDRKMTVKVTAPSILAYAPALLEGYRSPFDGRQVGRGWTPERVREVSAREGQAHQTDALPVVFAGFVISNSETGGGAFIITPRLEVEVCRNGLTITADALRAVHLGGKLDAGVVRWSHATHQRNLDLVASQAKDAVSTFLDVDYVTAKVEQLSGQAEAPVGDATKTVEHVAKTLRFGEAAQAGILDHFIRGGQMTAGGVLQAVTSYARTVEDADEAADLEAGALDALALAAL